MAEPGAKRGTESGSGCAKRGTETRSRLLRIFTGDGNVRENPEITGNIQ